MSEYKTLDEWFPDGKANGSKFQFQTKSRKSGWFKPVFQDSSKEWFGLNQEGLSMQISSTVKLKKYKPEPKTKKVKMYKPVYKDSLDSYTTIHEEWHTDKSKWSYKGVVGWMEMEAEVYE